VSAKIDEPEAEGEHERGAGDDKKSARAGEPDKQRHLARTVPSPRRAVRDPGDDDASDEQQSAKQVKEEGGVCHRRQRQPAGAGHGQTSASAAAARSAP
jgi:hypothetical protein